VNVVFATCAHQPFITPDDQPLADALATLGYHVEPNPWTEIDPYAVVDADPVILRSTWDYHRVPTMFAAWLDGMADSGRMLLNPAEVARGNIDKIYLQSLANDGIAIADTRWVVKPNAAGISAVLREEGWTRAVIKPRIAATAYGTFLIDAETLPSDDDLAPARASGALIQAYIPEIVERGEVAMIYAGGKFSHAVVRQAAEGEFRVQKDFGGAVVPCAPSADLLSFGARVMAQVPASCVYARVDMVETNRGPLLMELELIEPELYFSIVPGSAEQLARVIAQRLAEL
jgi:glutathione synthase/RimK-type ligase-like ATP-grasp enzyme